MVGVGVMGSGGGLVNCYMPDSSETFLLGRIKRFVRGMNASLFVVTCVAWPKTFSVWRYLSATPLLPQLTPHGSIEPTP